MCHGCWQEYGSPAIVNEKTLAAARAIEEVYEWSSVGGNLHVVLDDWNIENEHVQFCCDEVQKVSGQLEAEKECLTLLAKMNLKERASALAIYEGFVKKDSIAAG